MLNGVLEKGWIFALLNSTALFLEFCVQHNLVYITSTNMQKANVDNVIRYDTAFKFILNCYKLGKTQYS